jgi:hypothetical protein
MNGNYVKVLKGNNNMQDQIVNSSRKIDTVLKNQRKILKVKQ